VRYVIIQGKVEYILILDVLLLLTLDTILNLIINIVIGVVVNIPAFVHFVLFKNKLI